MKLFEKKNMCSTYSQLIRYKIKNDILSNIKINNEIVFNKKKK